ncbi:MAG: hypothetical protein J5871_03160 [Bacteroidales bacterium]|nr:hypothetical protein [Bacteroidales bacterium]
MASTKKTKKNETPIDERETFVSLQKTFADSEASTQEKLNTLYQLQQADNAIDKLVQLRGELPGEVAELEGEIAALTARQEKHEQTIAALRTSIDMNKQRIVEYDEAIARYQGQLENISNSREYDSINKEIENAVLEHQIAEKNISEALEAIDARKADIANLQDKIVIKQEDLAIKNEELKTIVASTAEEEGVLTEKRASLAAKLDEGTLSAYDRVRNHGHNHLAVVTVYNGDSCGGCFNMITPQRLIDIASGKKLIICEHCGRIIVSA